MIIDLTNVDYVNKGSYLMILAVVQYLANHRPNYKIAVDMRAGNARIRKNNHLYQILRRDIYKSPVQINPMLNALATFLPESIRSSQHVVLEKDVDAVLDAAGFAYSDQGFYPLVRMVSERYKRLKRAGKKIIFLPQAFGPFEYASTRMHVGEMIANADLVFARDRISLEHIRSISQDHSRIYCAPDFTNLVAGEIPSYFDASLKQPCIIPNFRMIDKTQPQIRERYLPTLKFILSYLLQEGMQPFFIIHESDSDFQIAQQLQNELQHQFRVIREPNPILIKGIIANCPFVISSRYHGLITSLSQGVPSIATSWSHKYEMLLEDYQSSQYLINFEESESELRMMIDTLIDPETRQKVRDELIMISNEQKKQTNEMWQQVLNCLEG